MQDLDHEAQLLEADALGAKGSKGVVHLRLALADPALALHEARELLQAVRAGKQGYRRGGKEVEGGGGRIKVSRNAAKTEN